MNGANALPWVSTMRPPTSAIATRMGYSQSFRRALRKAQSSWTKDIQNWRGMESAGGPGGSRSIQ